MNEYRSKISKVVEEESRMTGHQITIGLWGLLGKPRVVIFGGNPRELKDWLVSIGKGQLIYELSERKTLYLVYNMAEGKVSEFIESRLMGDPQH